MTQAIWISLKIQFYCLKSYKNELQNKHLNKSVNTNSWDWKQQRWKAVHISIICTSLEQFNSNHIGLWLMWPQWPERFLNTAASADTSGEVKSNMRTRPDPHSHLDLFLVPELCRRSKHSSGGSALSRRAHQILTDITENLIVGFFHQSVIIMQSSTQKIRLLGNN